MNHSDPLEDALKTVSDQTPPSPNQSTIRAAFLADARQIRQPENVSPQPSVRHRDWKASFSRRNEHRGAVRMTKFRRIAIGAALLILLLAGAAVAQEIIGWLVQGNDDHSESTFFYDPATPSAKPFPLTLEQAADQADFAVLVPQFIPQYYKFEGAIYSAERHLLFLNYECTGSWGLGIEQFPVADSKSVTVGDVGASAVIENLKIGDVLGQYVRGVWRTATNIDLSNGTVAPQTPVVADMVWDNNTAWQRLVWWNNGVLYQIATSGGSIPGVGGLCILDKTDYLNVANSLTAYKK